jgi:cytochrome c oxidase subunit II
LASLDRVTAPRPRSRDEDAPFAPANQGSGGVDESAETATAHRGRLSTAASGFRARLSERRRRLALGILLVPLVLGGCDVPSFWQNRGATKTAQSEFSLYVGTTLAAVVVGVIVGGLILWAIIRYRRRSDEMPRQFQYHIPLEITYTIVPIVIVLIIFGFTFATENNVDAIVHNPYSKVKVTAFQWGWKFDYTYQRRYVEGAQLQNPDNVGLNGKTCVESAPAASYCYGPGLVMPVGKTVEITLVSNDVIHGFYVNAFNFSRYAQPGIRNVFDFNVIKPGIYRAQCTQLCGLYHSKMFFHVVALPVPQFQAWLRSDQLSPDSKPQPQSQGSAANSNLPPAYPPNSHAGNVPQGGTS